MHLACGVFRAVETRMPLVIAANGGISAWIDRDGRIRAQSPRQQPDVILADVERGYVQQLVCRPRRLVRRPVFDVLRPACDYWLVHKATSQKASVAAGAN